MGARGWRRAGFALLAAWALTHASGASARDLADTNRAVVLAQQGAAAAETLLKDFFPFRAFETFPRPDRFWGGSLAESAEPLPGARVEDAASPSFAVELDGDPAAGPVTARTMTIEGAALGLSGASTGTYATNGDHYVLKVSDLSGRIHLNDGVEGGVSGSVSQNLKRILNILGLTVNVATAGDRILAGRPAAGYADTRDLAAVLGEADFARIKDFVTAKAWVDSTVANPVPLSGAMLSKYPVPYYRGSPPVFRFGSSKDASGVESAPVAGYMTCPTACAGLPHDDSRIRVYGLDSLNVQWIEIVSRAPVNVNAAPREVLVALLTDLQGFFLADRRRNNPRWKGGLYLPFTVQSNFSPAGTEGDELGFLVETYPIVGPGSVTGMGISAFAIADEIIACRRRTLGPSGLDYAGVAWSGPFRTWNQFNRFVDNLVALNVISDPRPIHLRYEEEVDDPTGFGPVVTDPMAQAFAARAVADVIKANFNPNLHLNELNPDANLFLRVDKTDLFVNSTEFCFAPTGHFEVQSLGRVVRPKDGAVDAFAAADNELVAQAKVTSVVRLYDLVRHTNQKQFHAGTLSPRTGGFDTNNSMSLEAGPEPDNGLAPSQNEWGGYLALPTIGGVWHAGPSSKAKDALEQTVNLTTGVQYLAALHSHFTLDRDACDHAIDRREIASRVLADESVSNHPDAGAAYPGPYDPTQGAGSVHRAARSFRLGGAPPTLSRIAPSDLRVDGLYAERHAAPAYLTSTSTASLFNFSTQNATGMVSFWFKPSFFPELTGKIRKTWDLTRYHNPCGQNVYVWPFEQVFLPTHYNTAIAEANQPKYWAENMGQFHPSSFYWGSKQWHSDSVTPIDGTHSGHEFGKVTRSLNHLGHSDEAVLPSVMVGHRWMNTTLAWTLNGTSVPGDPGNNYGLSRMWFNGSQNDVVFGYTSMTAWNERYDRMWGFELHAGGEYNHMRLGSPSRVANAAATAGGAFRGNYSPDFTFDELYVWSAEAAADPRTLWMRGRYHNVSLEAAGAGTHVSAPLALTPAPAVPPGVKVLGVSWTWFAEGANGTTGDPELYNHNTPTGVGTVDVGPKVQLTVQDGVQVYGPFDDSGFSAVRAVDGTVPVVSDPAQVNYRADFRLTSASAATVLLATPVLDDVTVYWHDGRASDRIDSAPPVTITGPATVADATAGVFFSQTFTASAGGPVTWSLAGTPPPGMTIDPAGVYSGVPGGSGTFTFFVVATSGGDSFATQVVQVIQPGASAPPAGGGGGGGGGCGLSGLEPLLLIALLGLARRRPTLP